MKTCFSYKDYLYKSNIREYLKYNKLNESYDKTHIIPNAFDVDLFFCNYVNGILEKYDDNNEKDRKIVMEYIKKQGLKGRIYHPKQLKNIFSTINIFHFLNKICIEHNFNVYDAKDFVNQQLYNIHYQYRQKPVLLQFD